MGQRLQLQTLLEQLLGVEPEKKIRVYTQPPANTKMVYPCILYERDDAETEFADNHPYRHTWRYMVTYIDHDPDSPVPDLIARLPLSSFSRHYEVAGLNHDVFSLYY